MKCDWLLFRVEIKLAKRIDFRIGGLGIFAPCSGNRWFGLSFRFQPFVVQTTKHLRQLPMTCFGGHVCRCLPIVVSARSVGTSLE